MKIIVCERVAYTQVQISNLCQVISEYAALETDPLLRLHVRRLLDNFQHVRHLFDGNHLSTTRNTCNINIANNAGSSLLTLTLNTRGRAWMLKANAATKPSRLRPKFWPQAEVDIPRHQHLSQKHTTSNLCFIRPDATEPMFSWSVT